MALRKFLILRSLRSRRLEGRTIADPVGRLLRLTACALMVVVAAPPAWAEDLAAVVSDLAGASFAAKEKAIVALGKLGDPLAVPILQALSDDRLRRAPDGRVVLVAPVGGTTKLMDPVSGQQLQDVAPDSLERIIVNNRLRGLIEAALGTLTLLSLGSVLLLAAIGLAIAFGVMGVINMAHGEMIMVGAYVAFVVQELFRDFLPRLWIDAYLVVAVPVAFLFAGLLGIVLERCLIRFLYGRSLETLLATWGVI